MFSGELDVLECRLATLEYFMSLHHVIVEARVDNHGREKPLCGQSDEAIRRLWRWRNRITYLAVDDLPGPGPWDRERQLRDKAMEILIKRARPDDIVLIADADEIPSHRALCSHVHEPMTLLMRDIAITLDRAWPERQPTSVIVPWHLCVVQDGLSLARSDRDKYPTIDEAGWHLSWLGGPEAVERKLAMHCHTRQELDERVSRLQANWDWPRWCDENAPDSWWSDPSLRPPPKKAGQLPAWVHDHANVWNDGREDGSTADVL